MLSWIIQFTIISVILIFLVHHLINFFTTTLTVPKIKDLVNSPNNEYKNIYEIIKNNPNKLNNSNDSNNYSLIDLLPNADEPSMKNELKNFLKKQLHSSSSEISGLDSMSNFQSYSKL
jgi:benzoyl-CoA reductase/2-hydroxyglutaryl-CoA dehydratase subunit BcrC/BadD/HgdB